MNFIGNEPILRSTGLIACRFCKIVRIRKHHNLFSHVSCQWMKPFTRLKEDHPRNRNILEIKKTWVALRSILGLGMFGTQNLKRSLSIFVQVATHVWNFLSWDKGEKPSSGWLLGTGWCLKSFLNWLGGHMGQYMSCTVMSFSINPHLLCILLHTAVLLLNTS